MTTDELLSLLLRFVNFNSNFVDVQWDRRMKPRLLFNPYTEGREQKKKTAHYFLLTASLLEDEIVGFSENSRRTLIHLHEKLGNRLFDIRKPHLFEEEIVKSEFYGDLGKRKYVIPEVLTSVNEFVKTTAREDLVEFSRRFSQPRDFVEEIARNTRRMDDPYKDKVWTYMRWMVRPKPDLGILNNFSPDNLQVPLTKENASVAASLGVIGSIGPYLWSDKNTAARTRERITNFSRTLFPKDPAKVDYPFFLLGRWLKQKNLNRNTLKEGLEFLDRMHKVTGQPHAYYQKLGRYKSGWEKKTAITLSKMGISYGYESISFPLPGDTYTPDFILDKSVHGRRIVLEPHYEMTPRQVRKYSLFKRTYGHEFLLILILKNDLIPFYHERNLLSDGICDDAWPIEFIDLLAEKIRTETYDQQEQYENM